MSDASFSENLISAYLDGELSPEESVHVERMMKQNPEYAQLLEEFQHQSEALKQLPPFELDSGFAGRVMANEAFAQTGRDEPSHVALPSGRPLHPSVIRERWIGAVASIGALAAMILIILVLPLFNSSTVRPVAVNHDAHPGELGVESASVVQPATSNAPARDGEDLATLEPLMAKGDLSSADVDGSSERVVEKGEGTLGESGTFGNSLKAMERARRGGAQPGDEPVNGKKEQMSNRKVADDTPRSTPSNNAGMGFGEEAPGGIEATEQMVLPEGQPEWYALDDSGGPFHSVNVMQIDLPKGGAEREQVFDLLRKHQVELPSPGEGASKRNDQGAVAGDTPSIYYVLADKAQMTGFAMELSNSSPAVIAMYRMGASNREKVGQYMQSPPIMQQTKRAQFDKLAKQTRQEEQADLGQQAQLEQQADLDGQLELGQQVLSQLRADNSIGVPMDSIIVKGGGVVPGGSGNPQEQLSFSYFARNSDNRSQGGGQMGGLSGGGGAGEKDDSEDSDEVENEGANVAKPKAVQPQIAGKGRPFGDNQLPSAPSQQDVLFEDHAVQVYLLIVQSRDSLDSNAAAEPAAGADKRPDQVPQPNNQPNK